MTAWLPPGDLHMLFFFLCLRLLRPNHANQAQVVAFLRRVLLRHSQGMKLDGKNILGLPDITHKVPERKTPRARDLLRRVRRIIACSPCSLFVVI